MIAARPACSELTTFRPIRKIIRLLNIGRSSNGRTPDSGSGYLGSNPSLPELKGLELTPTLLLLSEMSMYGGSPLLR